MKKIKAMLLIIAMLATMIVMPAQAATSLTFPITEDFDSITDVTQMKQQRGSDKYGWLRISDAKFFKISNKTLFMGMDKDYPAQTDITYALYAWVNSGKYQVSFDVKPGADVITNVYADISLPLIYFKDGNVYTADTGTKNEAKVGTYAAGTWYNVVITVNFDTKELNVKYKADGANTYTEKTISNYNTFIGKNLNELPFMPCLRVTGKNAGAGSYFDNLRIVKELPYSEDFSSYTDLQSMKGAGFREETGFSGVAVVDEAHGKSVKITAAGYKENTETPQDVYMRKFFSNKHQGKIKIKFSVNPADGKGATTNFIIRSFGASYYPVKNIDGLVGR